MEDVVKITLWVPDLKSLNDVLSSATVQIDCGAPKQEADGTFKITLYASPAEAKKITKLNFRHEVDEKYGEVLAERQQQVSKTDRFQGGKIKPEGLGNKR
jgi:hypothetical protein